MTGDRFQVAGGENDGGLMPMLLRRAWIPLLCGVLVGGLTFLVFTLRPDRYEACTYLKVNSGPVDDAILGLPAADKPLTILIGETAAEIEQLRVAQRTVEELQLRPFTSPGELLKSIKAEPDQNSGLVVVCAKGRTALESQRIADATRRAYTSINRAEQKAELREARVQLERQQRTRISRVRREGGDGIDTLESVRENQDLIERLQLAESINTDTVSVAKPALLPTRPAGIPPWAMGLLGLVLGGALGGTLIVIREQTDRRIRTQQGLERVLGVPVLTSITSAETLQVRRPLDMLGRADAEPFRLVFAKLANSAHAEGLGTVVVASVDPDGMSGGVAWYVGATAAASGSRVLILEADHDRPSAVDGHSGRPPGLTDVLAGDFQLDDVVVRVAVNELATVDVVSPGTSEGGLHLGGGASVRALTATASSGRDLVLIDTPPVVDADAVPFVRQAQGVILVYRKGGSDVAALRDARDELASIGTPLLGVIAVGFGR